MSSSSSGNDERFGKQLRSKGLLPALGVGATVYFVTGLTSLSTLGLVGIGAGVGYGVGSWIADKFQKKQEGEALRGAPGGGVPVEQLPWAVQVALQQWQDFVVRRMEGRQPTQADVDRLWMEFESVEPTHAMNARALVRAPQAASFSGPATASGGTGTTYVASVAAEV